MGLDYQLHRVAVDIAKGYRQIQKADKAFSKDNVDSAVNYLNKALNDFDAALEHAAKAEDDAYNKAGDEIDKGNAELKKSIEEYTDGHMERAESHFDSSDGGACSYLSHMSIYSSGHHFQKRSLDSGHFGYFLSNILVVRCCASPNVSGHA